MKTSTVLLFILSILLTAGSLQASETPFNFDTPAALGMGNTYLGMSSSHDSFLRNPACFAGGRTTFIVGRFSASLNKDATQLFTGKGDTIQQFSKEDNYSNIPSGFFDSLSNFHAHYHFTGPLFLAYKGDGFGLAIISAASGYTGFTGATIPTGTLRFDYDIGLIAGLGMPIQLKDNSSSVIELGINLKYISRVRFSRSNIDFFHTGGIVSPLNFHSDYLLGQAIGSDIGIFFKSKNTSIGVVWYDWFGMTFSWARYSSTGNQYDEPVEDTRVAPRISAGISYRPATFFSIPEDIISKTVLALDIRDFFVEENSFFNMLHMGLEFLLIHTFTMRMGFNRGYFTCGLSINLWEKLTIDYSYYGEEGGLLPGQELIAIHTLSTTLRL